MTLLQITSLLTVLAGGFGAINHIFLTVPSAIGIVVVSLVGSFAVMLPDCVVAMLGVADVLPATVLNIVFSNAPFGAMIGLLLFAGALYVKSSDLNREWVVLALMAKVSIAFALAARLAAVAVPILGLRPFRGFATGLTVANSAKPKTAS